MEKKKRTIRLVLPFPPSTNSYYRHDRGRTHISATGRTYRERVRILARAWKGSRATLRGSVGVLAFFSPPDHRERDLDNYQKPLWDALTRAGIWEDDSRVVTRREHFFEPESPGRVQLLIYETDPLGAAPDIEKEA